MTCNDKCMYYPVCEMKNYDFANIDECQYYEEKRPHGEWKPRQMLVGVGGNGAVFMHDGFECKCGRVVTQKENFCPECGADMR